MLAWVFLRRSESIRILQAAREIDNEDVQICLRGRRRTRRIVRRCRRTGPGCGGPCHRGRQAILRHHDQHAGRSGPDGDAGPELHRSAMGGADRHRGQGLGIALCRALSQDDDRAPRPHRRLRHADHLAGLAGRSGHGWRARAARRVHGEIRRHRRVRRRQSSLQGLHVVEGQDLCPDGRRRRVRSLLPERTFSRIRRTRPRSRRSTATISRRPRPGRSSTRSASSSPTSTRPKRMAPA